MPEQNHKQNIKRRIEMIEKEIFMLTGNQRAKARSEYHKLLRVYSKECGLEEPIYLKRA